METKRCLSGTGITSRLRVDHEVTNIKRIQNQKEDSRRNVCRCPTGILSSLIQ